MERREMNGANVVVFCDLDCNALLDAVRAASMSSNRVRPRSSRVPSADYLKRRGRAVKKKLSKRELVDMARCPNVPD
jgi:hypothetical protein